MKSLLTFEMCALNLNLISLLFFLRCEGIFLYHSARLPLDDQHCLATITKDVPLEYMIPTTTGAGALTVSLVDYLTLTHNDFVEYCSSKVKEKGQSSSKVKEKNQR